MKSIFLCVIAATTLFTVVADDGARKSREELKKEREARRIKAMNESGGFIADHRAASGFFVFVNAQKSVSVEVIKQAAYRCQNGCLILTSVVNGDSVNIRNADESFKKLNAKLAVFIIEESGLPMSIQCPESRWAIINVAALKNDNPEQKILDSRVRKMMSRTMAMMFQAGYSVLPKSTVQPIAVAADLDKITSETAATDCQVVIQQVAHLFGFKVMRRVFYRKALDEGWAPEPVTQIQKNCKEIWERAKKGEPTASLQIKYDAKTGGQVK